MLTKTITTVIETSHGYNVQIALAGTFQVIANASDSIRSIAERTAEQQAIETLGTGYTTTKNFISLV